jgi:DNA mismatch repair protein MutL
LNDRYVLAEGDHGLVLVDATAARRWLLAERFREALAGAPIASQPLLIPEAVALDSEAIEVLFRHADVLSRLGFEIDRAGPCALVIRSLPAALRRCDRHRLMHTLTSVLQGLFAAAGDERGGSELPITALVQALAASGADSIVGGTTPQESEGLLRALGSLAGSETAGLPGVWRHISYAEIAALLDAACASRTW